MSNTTSTARRRRHATWLLVAAFAVSLAGCTADDEPTAVNEPGPVHVHGLGINPATGSLMIATHTGLWEASAGSTTPMRVGDARQDTMGFTVVGPDHFLASGHPQAEEIAEHDRPPHLGLIESKDGGRSWETIALEGEADFHVLRLEGQRILALNARTGQLLLSFDLGQTWVGAATPEPFLDIVVSPGDGGTWVASAESGLYGSADEGRSWGRFSPRTGLLAWPDPQSLYLVDAAGIVRVSRDVGTRFSRRGVAASPTAFLATDRQTLYLAAHDGTVYISRDGGRVWTARVKP